VTASNSVDTELGTSASIS